MAESETDELQDTEITLSTGKLLGIFFGLVLLCSLFFTMGYLFGRANESKSKTDLIGSDAGSSSSTSKPSAVNKTSDKGTPTNAANNQTAPAPASASPAPASNTAPATLVPTSSGTNNDAQPSASAGGSYMVQVAAVSKREDADLLVSALQKRQYPVFVTGSQGDALFHVQVGPFSDPKDAETMRSRLSGDGYNAIVKK